jgi:hypothetical protein
METPYGFLRDLYESQKKKIKELEAELIEVNKKNNNLDSRLTEYIEQPFNTLKDKYIGLYLDSYYYDTSYAKYVYNAELNNSYYVLIDFLEEKTNKYEECVIVGSWDNWDKQKQIIEIEIYEDGEIYYGYGFEFLHDINQGVYEYKLKKENIWLEPEGITKKDQYGNVNNILYIHII